MRCVVGRPASQGPKSRSEKSAGWDGVEILRKKADFSGSFPVAGATQGDQKTIGEESSVATGSPLKRTGCPGWGAGEKGNRGVSAPHPPPTQERGGCPLRSRVRVSASCVSVYVRERQIDRQTEGLHV